MRILYLTHRIPFPPNKGDKIRSFHLLEHLSQRHDVRLATLIDDADDVASLPALRERVGDVLYARIDQPWRKPLALLNVLRAKSISVGYFYTRKLQACIDDLLDVTEFDAIVCSSSPMAEYLFRSRKAKTGGGRSLRLMDFIDVDSCKWAQYAERSPAWKAWIFRHEARWAV
jgi:hypothetical protein